MTHVSRAAFLAALFLISSSAFAATSGQWGFVSAIDQFREIISGPVAQGIAVLGIVACGIGLAFGGEMNQFLKTMVYVVMVVCLIITANGAVTWLGSLSGVTVSTGAQVAFSAPVSLFG